MESTDNSNRSAPVSMHDFLDFLKITCQVHESITKKNSSGNANQIDYNKLAKNELVNSLLSAKIGQCLKSEVLEDNNCPSQNISADRNVNNVGDGSHGMQRYRSSQNHRNNFIEKSPLNDTLAEKLNEVINEGILDSILPFICAANSPAENAKSNLAHVCSSKSKLNGNKEPASARGLSPRINTIVDGQGCQKNGNENNSSVGVSNKDRRRKSTQSVGLLSDHDVLIHVCDEVKGASRDFSCSQKLLVSKMGYFADVTAGQRLEDMDISVHCDLQIFEWLMRWVKKDTLAEEMWPLLDSANVVPILVSAGFLQMEPLLVDCLAYCHANLNEVVKASANLSCLNESIISRLAAMFTNLELEMVKDKKERVTPRLWIKMIHSLCEPEPQALRGHYSSLCDLFRCKRCLKYVNESMAPSIHCDPTNMHLNRYGQVISQHNRDTSWNLNHFISNLYRDFKSWRKIYWRMWGNCHYLYCATCETHFPLYQMNWCLYHPDQPQFLGPVTEGRMAGPAGRYPCCGQQAFRYETLPGPMGCQYREHTIQILNDRDRAILKLAQVAAEGNCLYEVAPNKLLNASMTNEPWWNGIILTPSRDRPGLLPQINLEDYKGRGYLNVCAQSSGSYDSSSETESSDNYRSNKLLKQFSTTTTATTSSDGCESDFSSSPRLLKPRQRLPQSRKIKASGRYWSGDISARSNQDNQRDFEERAMKQVISMVNKRMGNENQIHQQPRPIGGTYVHLEAEWREKHRQNKTKMMGK